MLLAGCAEEFGTNWPEFDDDDVVGFCPNIDAYEAKEDVLELWGRAGGFGSNPLICPCSQIKIKVL